MSWLSEWFGKVVTGKDPKQAAIETVAAELTNDDRAELVKGARNDIAGAQYDISQSNLYNAKSKLRDADGKLEKALR